MKWFIAGVHVIVTLLLGFVLLFVGFIHFKECPFDPQPFPELGPVPKWESNVFSDVKKYDIMKPEDIAFDPVKNCFYSGLGDGSVVRVDAESGQVETLLRPIDFNPSLKDLEDYTEDYCNGNPFRTVDCGQVLGTKLSEDGERLIMASKVFGIFQYDLISGKLERILNSDRRESGGIWEMYDDVIYGKGENSNKIYYSVVSDTFSFKGMFNVIWSVRPGGEVREYDLETKEEKMVIDNFYFTNGVLTLGDYLYVSDTTNPSVTKFDLKKGEIVDHIMLNVYADNLSYDEETERFYLAGLERNWYMEWLSHHPFLVRLLAVHPISLALSTLKLLRSDSGAIAVIRDDGGGGEEGGGMVVEDVIYDESGDVFKGIASVVKNGDYFYVGSYFHDQAVRFKLEK